MAAGKAGGLYECSFLDLASFFPETLLFNFNAALALSCTPVTASCTALVLLHRAGTNDRYQICSTR